MISIEFVHLIKILVNFLSTYISPTDGHTKIWSNRKIVHHYLTTTFPIDLISIVPLQIFYLKHERNSLWYLVKLIRVIPVVTNLDHRVIVKLVRSLIRRMWKLNKCDCREEDHNKIGAIHIFSYLLQFVLMIMNIFNFTFFISHMWMVFCYSIIDFGHELPSRFPVGAGLLTYTK